MRLRAHDLRFEALEDEIDTLSNRVARREGQAGRQKREEKAKDDEAEAVELLEKLVKTKPPAKAAAGGRPPARLQTVDAGGEVFQLGEDPELAKKFRT